MACCSDIRLSDRAGHLVSLSRLSASGRLSFSQQLHTTANHMLQMRECGCRAVNLQNKEQLKQQSVTSLSFWRQCVHYSGHLLFLWFPRGWRQFVGGGTVWGGIGRLLLSQRTQSRGCFLHLTSLPRDSLCLTRYRHAWASLNSDFPATKLRRSGANRGHRCPKCRHFRWSRARGVGKSSPEWSNALCRLRSSPAVGALVSRERRHPRRVSHSWLPLPGRGPLTYRAVPCPVAVISVTFRASNSCISPVSSSYYASLGTGERKPAGLLAKYGGRQERSNLALFVLFTGHYPASIANKAGLYYSPSASPQWTMPGLREQFTGSRDFRGTAPITNDHISPPSFRGIP